MAQARKMSAAKAAKQSAEDRDLQAMRDIADDVIESDFVPYACLFDPDTLLTKNGELLHIIRITGQQAGGAAADVRTALRQAIANHIPDASYAIWLHTVRRKQQAAEAQSFPDAFSQQLDRSWREQHTGTIAYTNELTITLVKAGQSASIGDFNDVVKSLSPRREVQRRNAYLEESGRSLRNVTEKLLASLAPYGARLLTTVEREGVFYGEHIEFLEKLINLEERPMPLPRRDLSHVLTSGDVTFGFNAMEVRTAGGHRRFAALMTVKEYKESTLRGIDQFLEIPCELIVTQCFDFIGAERAQESYEKQAEYLRISGDKELAGWMEIGRLSGSTAQDGLAFGQQQTSIFLIAASTKQLEANVRMVQKSFSRIGIVAIREDLRVEECYWAQLPGNFPFLTRHHSIDSHHLAGFANLPSRPLGDMKGSSWGPPVTLFKTINDTPYHFNFHRGDIAHSLLVGRNASELAVTGHFLLAQARKFPLRVWMLDGTGRSTGVITAMEGKVATPGTPSLRLNPLQLPDTAANREFLAVWLSTLADPLGRTLNRTTLEFFQMLVMQVMQLPVNQRRLSSLLPLVRENDAMLAKYFARWCEGGELGTWFDMPDDTLSPATLQSFNLSACVDDERRVPMVSYLLHRLTGMLGGAPTLIVLNDALTLLNTPLYSTRVTAWLDFLSAHNAACMSMTSTIAYASAYPYARVLSDKAASLLVHPDDEIDGEYIMGYGLTDEDLGAVAHMAKTGHQLLLKRGSEASIVKLNPGLFGSNEHLLRGDPAPLASANPKDVLAELMGFSPTGVA